MQSGSVAIIGGGTMGCDIAAIFVAAGWSVHVMTPSSGTRAALPTRVDRALLSMDASTNAGTRLVVHAALDTIPWSALALAIEAVTEELALKRDVLSRVEALAPTDLPLASNTSNFSIGSMAEALRHPQRLFGMHFFMPAHLVPLVEIVSSAHTNPALAEFMVMQLRELGKTPIWVRKDVPGFVGNRIQHAMLREALYLLEEGVATAEEIDVAVRFGFGFRLLACGPILQKEMSGWDTHRRAGTALFPHLHNEAAYPPALASRIDAGRTGMKALAGIWDWTPKSAATEREKIEQRLRRALALLYLD